MANLGLPSKVAISDAIAPDDFRAASTGRNFAAGPPIKVFFLTAKPYSDVQAASQANVGWVNSNFQSVRDDDKQRVFDNVFLPWSKFANINFEITTDMQMADIRVGVSSDMPPGLEMPSVNVVGLDSGRGRPWNDVFISPLRYNPTSINLLAAGLRKDYFAPVRVETSDLMHEVGHAIGLQHPAKPQDGGTLPAEFNYLWFTAMTNHAKAQDGFSPTTPMIMDLVGLQTIYGLRGGINAGNDVHRLDSGGGPNSGFVGDATGKVIVDTNGNDTLAAEFIDANGVVQVSAKKAHIDLRPAHFSAIEMNDVDRLRYNVAIWYDSEIENAVGGSGDDVIIGNDFTVGNILEGNGGADTLNGGLGADTLYGERRPGAAITVFGAAGGDWLDGGGADNAQDKLYGGAGSDTYVITQGGGVDIIYESETSPDRDTVILKDERGFTVRAYKNLYLLKDPNATNTYRTSDGGLAVTHNSPYTLLDSTRNVTIQFGETETDFRPAAFGFTLHDAPTINGKINTGTNTLGNDTLGGTSSNDRIRGSDGRDTLRGYGATSTLSGDDWLEGGIGGSAFANGISYVGGDFLYGGDGSDTLFGDNAFENGTAQETLNGIALQVARTTGASTAIGDVLSGDAGDDVLIGGDAINFLAGGAGGDLIVGGAGLDYIFGGRYVTFAAANWAPANGGGNFTGFLDSTEDAQDGGDAIYAGAGNDQVQGGLGDDYIDLGGDVPFVVEG